MPLFGDVVAVVYRRRSDGTLYEHPFDEKAECRYDAPRNAAIIFPAPAAFVKAI